MSASWLIDLRPLVAAQVHDAAGDGLFDAAEYLLEEANRTVPLEETILEGSGFADIDYDALEAAVSYDTPYAARQHEETGWAHDSGRRAKWLELTVHEQANAVRDFMADRLREALR